MARGVQYVRHDGGFLAFVPGEEGDPDYEQHLHETGVRFRAIRNFDGPPPIGMHPQTGQHLSTYRTFDEVDRKTGQTIRSHVVHHHDGRREQFHESVHEAGVAPLPLKEVPS